MTTQKVKKVIELYEQKLKSLLATERWEGNSKLEHLLEMCPQVKEFCDAGREGKAFRWLGFLQGALWTEGVYTIEEMKNHNRPTKEDFPGHSMDQYTACSACGDLDGCHKWKEIA